MDCRHGDADEDVGFEKHLQRGQLSRLNAGVQARIDQVIVGSNAAAFCPTAKRCVIGDRELTQTPTENPRWLIALHDGTKMRSHPAQVIDRLWGFCGISLELVHP